MNICSLLAKYKNGNYTVRLLDEDKNPVDLTKYFGLNPIEYARSIGVKVGENCRFIVHPQPWNLPDFGSEPFLIEIGNEVCISFGCTFLTHDASMHVCKKFLKDVNVSKYGKISIGNNVFIGCNSTILPKVSIGNDCIIGAGSVVTKSIPDGEVWGGAPARFIPKTIDYAQKIKIISLSQEQEQLKNIVNENRLMVEIKNK